MQYIQLQGQVVAELDLPLEGSYNLFIDTSDNLIKAKDSEGNLTGGGAALTELTKAQLDNAIEGGDLTPGAFYKITGVSSGSNARYIQEGGTTIILQASSTTSLNPKGVGLFWNPKYYNPNTDLGELEVWSDTFTFTTDRYITGEFFDMEETIYLDAPSDIILRPNIIDNTMLARIDVSVSASYFLDSENYPISFESSNTGITGSLTALNNQPPAFTSGSKVIWGGRVWGNLNGNLGSSDGQWSIEGPEWQVVPYNSTDYDLVADIIEYDYQNDCICYRKDVVHNVEVISNYEHVADDGEYNLIRQFPWGHPQTYGVTLENVDTQNLVNFPTTNVINELHMKHGSRFEANYWGSNNHFRNIFGDCDSDIENLSLGKWAHFNRIRLSINSTIGGQSTLFIVGNDGDTITDITMGTNCEIYGMTMYQYSYLDDITMGMNSSIYNMNMYDESQVRDLAMSNNSSLNNISMGKSADIYNIELDLYAYIGNINMDTNSQLNGICLGRSSYMEYSSLGYGSSMYDIKLGVESSIACVQLNDENGQASSINTISLGDGSSFGSVILGGNTYINQIDGLTNSGFGEMTLTGSNAYISDFELGQGAQFGGFTVDSTVNGDAYLENFKIGQNNGFGGGTYVDIITDVTIDRTFNNFEANQFIAGVTASFSPGFSWADTNTLTSLDTNKSFQILDTTGWDASTTTLNYYLANGDYDGQTIKFFLSQDDGNNIYNNAGNLRIWMNIFTQNFNLANYHIEQPWYPFSYWENISVLRTDIPTVIWLNGKWVIDNNQWD